jgi:hypothetical protein
VIRVVLPHHLRTLAGVTSEVSLDRSAPVSWADVVDALEGSYPALHGTIRDPATRRRRPFIRFFAGGTDLSHYAPSDPLPTAVASGAEPLFVVGAMAGG